jgi:glycosyltransferase involved in cell wall biosynthesis
VKVDIVGNIGDGGGVGNYSTKLYHNLKKLDDIEVGEIEPQLSFPILESTVQNFLEVPIKVLMSDADVVHLTSQERASGLAFIPEKYLQNVVVTVHDISPYVNDYAGPVSQIVSRFYCHALKKVPKLVAISQFTKNEVFGTLDIEEDRIDVVYQGVDTDYFYPREKNQNKLDKYGIEQPYILYVGSEIERKNMEGVIEKFSELQGENPELTLVKVGHAGRKKYRQKTRKYIEDNDLEIGEDVIFTGFVDEEDLPQVYSSAEATILWSHYEGFGRSILESTACGTSIVAKDEPPMNEWVNNLSESVFVEAENSEITLWRETVSKISSIYEEVIRE